MEDENGPPRSCVRIVRPKFARKCPVDSDMTEGKRVGERVGDRARSSLCFLADQRAGLRAAAQASGVVGVSPGPRPK